MCLSHRRRAITQCVNAINGKIRTLYILMILPHCSRNAASRVQCKRIIKIYIRDIFFFFFFQHKIEFYFTEWTPKVVFSRVAEMHLAVRSPVLLQKSTQRKMEHQKCRNMSNMKSVADLTFIQTAERALFQSLLFRQSPSITDLQGKASYTHSLSRKIWQFVALALNI